MDPCYGRLRLVARQLDVPTSTCSDGAQDGPPLNGSSLLLFAAVPGADSPEQVRGLARQCSRPGCAERAVVSLTYQYGRAQVWIDELHAERDPHAYDLCRRHTAGLSVPRGWRLSDRRRTALPILRELLA
jgi:Protein of unknown function (DUF3499)